jgi:hypothetical protein
MSDNVFLLFRKATTASGSASLMAAFMDRQATLDDVAERNRLDPESSGQYFVAKFEAQIESMTDFVASLGADDVRPILEDFWRPLPLLGDETDTVIQNINHVPAARFLETNGNYVKWNIDSPIGSPSGMQFKIEWEPTSTTSSGCNVQFSITTRNISPGDKQHILGSSGIICAESGPSGFVDGESIESIISLPFGISESTFSIRVERLSHADTYDNHIYVTNFSFKYGVNYA